MKKERPILFSTQMVKAVINGRKTQTRRVVKPMHLRGVVCDHTMYEQMANLCPYGKVGDLLWVRESCTWVMNHHAHDLLEGAKDNNQWVYKASTHDHFMRYAKEKYGYKWKPSIHMPKSACRIWLEIVSIRVERLKDISENDAIAEGIHERKHHSTGESVFEDFTYYSSKPLTSNRCFNNAKDSFKSLWYSINGEESWNDNPWVWVIQFKVIKK